jgi:hypothetical protein
MVERIRQMAVHHQNLHSIRPDGVISEEPTSDDG